MSQSANPTSPDTRKIAVMFPGQGSQKPAMAAPWQALPAFARWQEASDILGWDVQSLGLTADAETLQQPDNCQVALFVHHCVVWDTWAAQAPQSVRDQVILAAGHSLGEYNALYCTGILGYEQALRLVDVRARATMDAATKTVGRMVALLGMDREVVQRIAQDAGAFMANENAPGQITISGSPEALDQVRALVAEAKGRAVDVAVGAGYHSPLMAPALDELGPALDATTFGSPTCAVVANVDAHGYGPGEEADWPDLLRRQLVNPVLWLDSMRTMQAMGATQFMELGASTPLSGMLKRLDGKAVRTPVTEPGHLESTWA